MPHEFHRAGSVESQQAEVLATLKAISGRLEALEGRGTAAPQPAAQPAPAPAPLPKRKWTEELLAERDSQQDLSDIQHAIDTCIVYREHKKLNNLLSKVPQDHRLPMIGAARVRLVTTDLESGEQKSGLDKKDLATLKILSKWGAPCTVETKKQEIVKAA